MNFFQQGVPLGRWFGITVVIHWLFLLYAAFTLLISPEPGIPLGLAAMNLALLFGTVLLHEFGHALSCKAVGGEALHIVLWPLGGIAFVQPPMNPRAWLITTVCGPLVNAILWPLFFVISRLVIQHQYGAFFWDEVVNLGVTSDPNLDYASNACLYMWKINKALLLFNLIPAYPMDGGRVLQEIFWFFVGYAKSMMIAGMIGTVAGAGFVVIGLGLQDIHIPPPIDFQLGEKGHTDTFLMVIGFLCASISWGVYQRSREIKSWRKN